MTDKDLLLDEPGLQFGSGVIGACDICKTRQAVIILQKERFKLCVIDFLNKSWLSSKESPGRPLPAYRSDRVWFETSTVESGRAPAIALSPTKVVKHPHVLVVPDIYGLTAGNLEAGIRLAREGFEVLLPDLGRTPGVGPVDHLTVHRRSGVPAGHPRVQRLVSLYSDALAHLRGRNMVDTDKGALFGLSYGGSLAVALAATEPKISALALAYPRPLQPGDFPRLVTAPTLMVVPQRDRRASAAKAQFVGATPDRSNFESVELSGVGHHFMSRELGAYSLPEAERAWELVLAFFRRRLLPPPPKPPGPILRPSPPPVPAVIPPATPASVTPPSAPAVVPSSTA